MRAWSFALSGILAILVAAAAEAVPTLRHQVDEQGDFVLLGNSTGFDCDASVPDPVAGTIPSPRSGCGPNVTDDAPDILWYASDTAAAASPAVTPDQASSTAVLILPQGATVIYARLYWGALLPAGETAADANVTLTRPGTSPLAVTADRTFSVGGRYQGTAEVSDFVRSSGPGAFRVAGIRTRDFRNVAETNAFVGWAMVVFYKLTSQPQRNLTLFDGFDQVTRTTPVSATLSGFRVPASGFDGKLGVVVYEGDHRLGGDALLFDGHTLSNALNPANNFFNGSRTYLGTAVSNPGDWPQLSGQPNSLSGLDLDVVDVTPYLTRGQTQATIRATSTQDIFYLGAFVTSVSTLAPNFRESQKTVRDLTSTTPAAGDTLEYTIEVRNTGFDTSQATVLTDTLPAGVTFVPGSIEIVSGPNSGPKTDATDSDQAEYNAQARTLTVRLGTGANGTTGGSLLRDQTTVVRFRVTIDAGTSGVIANQAIIRASGVSGAPATDFPTDGDPTTPGQQDTTIGIDQCQRDADCPVAKPFCRTTASPKLCVQCRGRSDCADRTPVCNVATGACQPCVPAEPTTCPDPAKPVCQASGALAGACTECSAQSAALCTGNKPQCLADLGICGCSDLDGDSECGSQTSGIICNGPAGICVPGCSLAAGRNRCPAGQACSNTTGGVGTCVTDECQSDAQCTTAPLLHCDTTADPNACVQCLSNDHCTGGLICDVAGTKRCQECSAQDTSHCQAAGVGSACVSGHCGCTADGHCGGSTSGRICDAATSRCVLGCRGTGGNGCPAPQQCSSTTSSPGVCQGCRSGGDCSGRTPYCDPATSTCVACRADGPPSCPAPETPACQRTGDLSGACTECSATNSSRCTGDTPVCLVATGVCVGCAGDGDCSGDRPYCDPASHTCARCSGDGPPSCPDPNRPTCLPSGGCGCTADGECGDAHSGRVCDTGAPACIDGCRGSGGNGCPSGFVCTSRSEDIGTCEPTSDDGGVPDEACAGAPASDGRACGADGKGVCVSGLCQRLEISGVGCGCSAGPGGPAGTLSFAALLLYLMVRRRRRIASRKELRP
jgi:uncharacterized repeat protein (TIGR01451 family)/uncharacterized protein (TIGR03382 family)